jgi:hypothetical protein
MTANPEAFDDRPVPVRPLDGEQSRMLEILRAARGRPVTFAELRSRGIENPAVLCYELEIAGLPITHVERAHVGAAPVPVGVQLDEHWVAAPPLPEEPPPWSERLLGWPAALAGAASVAGTRARMGADRMLELARDAWAGGASASGDRVRALAGRVQALARDGRPAGALGGPRAARATPGTPRPRHAERGIDWIPPASRRARAGLLLGALALALAIALAIGLSSGSSHNRRPHFSAGHRDARASASPPAASAAGALARRTPLASASAEGAGGATAGGHAAASAESGAHALQLQGEGHQLLAEGRYAAATNDLRAAITTSGGSPARCQEPSSEACLAYAYALYDLGRALQAQHEPAAAVPVLNERLRIDNQRQTVRAQLKSAREQMHSSSSAPAPRHRPANTHEQRRRPGSGQHGSAPPARAPEATGEQPQPPASGGGPPSEGAGESPRTPSSGHEAEAPPPQNGGTSG